MVGDVAYGALYNHAFTTKERASAYSDFLNAVPLLQELRPRQMPEFKASDLSNVSGLITSYNFILS